MAGDSDTKPGKAADNESSRRQPFLIGVAGGTASGKSSVCSRIMELLGQNEIDHHQRQVAILSQDSFYRVLTPEQKAKALKGQFNFDHPGMVLLCHIHASSLSCVILQQDKLQHWLFRDGSSHAFDNDLIITTLWDIKEGKTVHIPVYDFVSHSRKEETVTVYPADVVLFEGY
ncbi:hypothetical protein INR49_008720 [Caranx melampygus]|nr:hypothetical protein INR49_008720 [Caranx melampygus]